MMEECFGEGPFVFRLNDSGSGPQLLTQVCLERGWKEFNPVNGDHWNLWWKTSGFPTSHHRALYGWQYINHIPKGSAICRKDNLARYLRCMRKVYGSIYDFSPMGYNLPLEYTKLAAECSRSRPESEKYGGDRHFAEKPVWICKPVGQSQGRGIFLFRKLSELTYDSNTIVQRYIERPLLIGGYKFDLRLYVCIPSYYPLTVYMYREGLTRFGTDKFSLNDLRNPFRHLTNCSINKLSPGYGEMKERVGSGCKWTLRRLRKYFQQAGLNDWLLWQRISVLVILTLISHASQIPQTVNCFEFFGFDVLIDNTLRPWLLEVNMGPALGNDCDVDIMVKKPMLHDMFDLLGFPLHNTGLSVFDIWRNSRSDEEDEESLSDSGCQLKEITKMTVLNAANKWRRKPRKLSATSRVHSANRRKPRILSPAQKPLFPKIQPVTLINQRLNTEDPVQHRYYGDETRRKRRWGNGRDWNMAPSSEGGWIRLWPMKSNESEDDVNNNTFYCNGNLNTKNMVAEVIKFSKLSKEIFKKHPNVTECQRNDFLSEGMGLNGEIWLPPL
ncbi:hypothetical protein PPYR_09361 [Photinus pyralis]|uniref:Tubulin polyglutamylase TTLL2 n=4 Tax=Photinus pyralis TaxID=7054 RepID=A0A5N4AMD1_PHOPY|nr:probable tubulin polyglutamylase TTLL2 isoform X1 [Photinus pyralis]KAB0798368.1 hypothetical protein PPYR_09361 [Photinus pyralis]